MNANTEIDLDTLLAVIVDQVKAKFPALTTVEFDRDEASAPPQAPACLLEMTESEKYSERDPGTGQLEITARFEARLLLAFNVPNAKREARKLALAFATWMHQRRWGAQGCPSGPAEIVGAYRDDFSPVLDKYEAWRVEWTQEFTLGQSVWTADTAGVPPSEILVRGDGTPGAEARNLVRVELANGQAYPVDEYDPLSQEGCSCP